jgi:signal transduction histidine kinase
MRRRRSRSKRAFPLSFRVAAIYAMLVAATLLVVAGLALQFTRNQVGREVDVSLLDQAHAFNDTVPAQVSQFEAEGLSPNDALTAAGGAWLKGESLPGGQAAYIKVAGASSYLGQAVTGFTLPKATAVADVFESNSPGWFTIKAGGGVLIRMLRVPITVKDSSSTVRGSSSPVGILVLAASQSAVINSSTLSLLKDVALASLIGLAFATTLGLIAVRRTLRPLEHMAREVESIQETDDLSKRVSGYGPRDEVGRLAEAFDRMLGRLQESFLTQRRFLSDASHELRTPMTVVRGQLELLAMDVESIPGRRSMSIAVEELDRMGRIVEDLLLLARLDEGMPLARETVEVELVVGEALLRGMLMGPGDVIVEVPPALSVLADADRLLQVLTNLITNAVRHGAGSQIAVKARRDGPQVRIDVSDRGPGIPPGDLPHVFERLYRGSKARSESPSGAGLGLAIARSLVEAMGGTIGVASTMGVGTTFTVTLAAAEPILQLRPLAGAERRGPPARSR